MQDTLARKTYTGDKIETLPDNGVFVFGSNTEGRHGKGAALVAKTKFGAIYGQAMGLQGRSYAIITKNLQVKTHPSVSKEDIVNQIKNLYNRAYKNTAQDFYVAYTSDGSNLNGYLASDMASMFLQASQKAGFIPENIIFQDKFWDLISK